MKDVQWWLNFFENLFDKPHHPPHGDDGDGGSIVKPEPNFDKLEWDGGKCQRFCGENEKPRICYYHWTMEHYHVMGP